MLRQPIVTIMGHVDHGKTSLLDSIRGSAVAKKEAGGITQAIGASIIPLGTIKKVCGPLLDTLKLKISIPGLLFIDTPGHAAFTNLRKRGGNLADIAILVVDIMEGLKPQTVESIEVLKSYKTPFIIVANKIDTIAGWQKSDGPLMQELVEQTADVTTRFERHMYELIGQIYEKGLQTERFDRVEDHTKQVAIVPASAMTGSGIPELLMTLTGLAQKFLETKLDTSESDTGKGTILEVKEQQGLGTVMDVIVYSGELKTNDTIVVGTLNQPKITRIKTLLEPAPLQEMREKKSSFAKIGSARASTGVRVVAQDMAGVVAGMPVFVAENTIVEETVSKVKEHVDEVMVETDGKGILIKADSLGSVEALMNLLKEHKIPVRKTGIGSITKNDLADAQVALENDEMSGVIIGFNIPQPSETGNIKVLTNPVIYRLILQYEEWKKSKESERQLRALNAIANPCKIELLKNHTFRQSNPAVVGVEVLTGTLKSNTRMMNAQGKEITVVKGIQLEKKNVDKAERGKEVAVSLPNVTVDRQIKEGDILFSFITENEFREYKEFKEFLSEDEKEILREIAVIHRRDNPVWGV